MASIPIPKFIPNGIAKTEEEKTSLKAAGNAFSHAFTGTGLLVIGESIVALHYNSFERKNLNEIFSRETPRIPRLDFGRVGEFSKKKYCKVLSESQSITLSSSQTEKEAIHTRCNNEDLPGMLYMPMLVLGAFFLQHGIKSIRKSAAFLHFSRNAYQKKLPFIIGGDADEPAPEKIKNEIRRFSFKNGVTSLASIVIDPDGVIYSSRGAFLAKEDGIQMTPITSMGTERSLSNIFKRVISREWPSLIKYENTSTTEKKCDLTMGHYQFTEIDLPPESSILCDEGAFFASSQPVQISLSRIANYSFKVFGGQGMTMQRIRSMDKPTNILIASRAQSHKRELASGEKIQIQRGGILAITANAEVALEKVGGWYAAKMLGEERFMTTIAGPCVVWYTSGNGEQTLGDNLREVFEKFIPGIR
jgi:uncharacterized protein (AIM24 family)